jgi:chromosome segregation ATPase
MKNILIHKQNDQLLVTHFVKNLDVSEIQQKAESLVPFGQLYRIGTIEDLPDDRTFRDAWDIGDADFNGIAGRISTQNSFDRELKRFESLQAQLQHAQQHLSEINQAIIENLQKINQLESAENISSLSLSDIDTDQEVSSLSLSDIDTDQEVSSLSFADTNQNELEDLKGQLESFQSSFRWRQDYVDDLSMRLKQSSDEVERLQQLLDELEAKFPSQPVNESTDDQN